MGPEPKPPDTQGKKKMGADTEMFKAERSAGVLMYRGFIVIALTAITALGGWNLKSTHDAAVLIEGLTQHVKDRDEEMNRLADTIRDLAAKVESIKDRQSRMDTEIRDRASRLDTRISIIETEINKP